jgi:glyoxylase-like metal-dependent hydrolase (beta-lactamase superfamily II)
MFFLQRAAPSDTSSLAYLFGCGGKGHAIAVDVHAEDVDWFLQQAAQQAVKIDYVIDTHIHADHVSGGRELAQRCGGDYCLHESSTPQFEFTPLKDGQVLTIGNVTATVLHTPGHTADSICLLVSDVRRSEQPWFLLTGHTLFVGSAGRPDLRGEEERMGSLLHDSLFNKLLTLPEHVEVFPGAQAGSVCGAGISGKPSSTIAFEKRFNTALVADKAAFIAAILGNLPPQPANMAAIIQRNVTGK